MHASPAATEGRKRAGQVPAEGTVMHAREIAFVLLFLLVCFDALGKICT